LQNPAQLKALPGLPSPSDQEEIPPEERPGSQPSGKDGRTPELVALPDAAEHAVFKFRASESCSTQGSARASESLRSGRDPPEERPGSQPSGKDGRTPPEAEARCFTRRSRARCFQIPGFG